MVKWESIGFIWTGILGVLLHFAYEWLGGGRIVAIFSAVNESTWEHLKLLFVPAAIFTIWEYCHLKEEYPGLLWIRTKGILLGMAWIVVAFYTYTGVLGRSISWVNIVIFFIGVAIVSLYVLKQQEEARKENNWILGAVVLAVLALMFMIFTFWPPNIGLFWEPTVM